MKDMDFEQAWRIGQFWMDMMSRMSAAGVTAATQGTAPPDAARQVRSAAFESMSRQAEQYLRSPQFLDSMKQSMGSTLDMQKQWQEFFTMMRHQTQGVAMQDVNATMVMVRHLEHRVIDHLEEISTQLSNINSRLDRLESKIGGEPANPPSRVNGEMDSAPATQENGGSTTNQE